jgi:hypothetical protein
VFYVVNIAIWGSREAGMEDSYFTKKSGIDKLDTADKAEHQLLVKHFNKSEEKHNNNRLLFGGERIKMPRK